MRTLIKWFSVFFIVLVLLLGSLRLHPYYQMAIKHDALMEKTDSSLNDTLKIAFIGDSWAAYHHQYDSLLCSMLSSDGHSYYVISKGNVGAKSKQIYQCLSTTTKPILLNHPNYCIVSAGINDAVAKLGKEYYVYHCILILQQLLELEIKPVVLEMPEVNYHAIAGREPWMMRIRHMLSSMITDSEMYGFDTYKTALIQAIKNANMQSRIIYISADSWNTNGYMNDRGLYMEDETHLNAVGYEVLDSCIASEIHKDIRNNQ